MGKDVEALIERVDPRSPNAPYGLLRTQAANALRTLAAENQALRERAEAAEAERDRQYDENVHRIAMQARAENERDAARRAEAAAWNDAIEAAGNLESIHGYSNAVPRHRIRALRRAAPTGDRCAECDCENGGTECTWIKSGPVAAPLSASPAQG